MRSLPMLGFTLYAGVAVAAVTSLAGCGDNGGNHGGGCTGNRGVVRLDWTVRGAAASTTSCMGIDHLELDVFSPRCGEVLIGPIPCAIGHAQYRGLFEGAVSLDLVGVDTGGQVVVEGVANATLPAVDFPDAGPDLAVVIPDLGAGGSPDLGGRGPLPDGGDDGGTPVRDLGHAPDLAMSMADMAPPPGPGVQVHIDLQ